MTSKRTVRGSLALAMLLLGGVVDVRGALAGTPGSTTPEPPSQTVVIRVGGGLRWVDIGVGAAVTLAVIALGYGLVLALRRNAPRGRNEQPL